MVAQIQRNDPAVACEFLLHHAEISGGTEQPVH